MIRQDIKVWLLTELILFAACLAGTLSVRAAQCPGHPANRSGVPARNPKLRKRTQPQDQKSRAANAQRQQPGIKSQSNGRVSAETADEIAQLKRQVALQQQQIDQLLHAVNELQAKVAGNPKPVAAPAGERAGNNQVASLAPILPPERKAQPAVAEQAPLVHTPVSPLQAKGPKEMDLAGPQSEGLPRSAVTSSESLPAGQGLRPGHLEFDHGKLRIGTMFFGLYRYYPKTGFGPQTLPEISNPGPDNGGFNSFDINRTFINLFFSPNDALTFRVTPNIYRQYGGASAASLSKEAAVTPSVNGNLTFRVRYAYVDFNKPFAHSKAFGKDVVTFGQQQNPLVEWENSLYGYRFVNSVPWNHLSLSTVYAGLRLHGPIEMHGKQYLDYDVGVFNNSSFHTYETGDRKQVMGRLSYYPFGAVSQYQGLGLTGFVDYGYRDAAPDLDINVPITRLAALVHYTARSKDYGIAGEFDYGRNAFTVNNLFSGSGPADAFGLGPTPYAAFSSMAAALLGGAHTRQRGFDFFGHARIAKSPFYLFGTFMQFNPNTLVSRNPLDFRTVIGGVSYKYGKYWQFAVDSQNVIYYHGQFTFPASELAIFSPSLAASKPNGIPNAVPDSTNAIFFNVLFNY